MANSTALPTLALLVMFSTGCGSDNDDGEVTGCSPEACLAACEDTHAEDLETCNEICAIEAHCTTDDKCSCRFYPCDDAACQAWCVANSEFSSGACNLLTCECF